MPGRAFEPVCTSCLYWFDANYPNREARRSARDTGLKVEPG